jgi:predicted GIY-YIG superfamily endonuclease
MWYVYIIRSINFPKQGYIGATSDLKRRLPETTPASRRTPPNSSPGIGLVLRLP